MGKVPHNDKPAREMGVESAFKTCEMALKRYLARYLHRREDIEDMVQETYLRAHKATQKRWVEYPKAYLFKVARTVALSELSKKMQQLTDYLEEIPAEEPGSDSSIDEELIAEQRLSLYCDAVAELPPQCRRVFLMRKVQGMSHKEIAEELAITTSAVERNITRGVFQFQRYVNHKDQEQARLVAEPHGAKDPGGIPS